MSEGSVGNNIGTLANRVKLRWLVAFPTTDLWPEIRRCSPSRLGSRASSCPRPSPWWACCCNHFCQPLPEVWQVGYQIHEKFNIWMEYRLHFWLSQYGDKSLQWMPEGSVGVQCQDLCQSGWNSDHLYLTPRLTSDPKIAVVAQVDQAPWLLFVQDPHHDELGAVIISVNLYLKYGKWGVKSTRNSVFKRNMDFIFA